MITLLYINKARQKRKSARTTKEASYLVNEED